ncbi:UNVERIFIED_CONTAM: hypothetical protein H355_006421 [Colinus virginianus]|nr:hypothetical protein H355_006421 [Colinus virginianus]
MPVPALEPEVAGHHEELQPEGDPKETPPGPEKSPPGEMTPEKPPLEKLLPDELPADVQPPDEPPPHVLHHNEPPPDELPLGSAPLDELPPNEMAPSETPPSETPLDAPSLDELPPAQPPLSELPPRELPLEKLPLDELPLQKSPPCKPPGSELTLDELPLDERPPDEPRVDEMPPEKPPLDEQPLEEQPPLDEQPPIELPSGKELLDEQPPEELPPEKPLLDELPLSEQPPEEPLPSEQHLDELPANEAPLDEPKEPPISELPPPEELHPEEPSPCELPAEGDPKPPGLLSEVAVAEEAPELAPEVPPEEEMELEPEPLLPPEMALPPPAPPDLCAISPARPPSPLPHTTEDDVSEPPTPALPEPPGSPGTAMDTEPPGSPPPPLGSPACTPAPAEPPEDEEMETGGGEGDSLRSPPGDGPRASPPPELGPFQGLPEEEEEEEEEAPRLEREGTSGSSPPLSEEDGLEEGRAGGNSESKGSPLLLEPEELGLETPMEVCAAGEKLLERGDEGGPEPPTLRPRPDILNEISNLSQGDTSSSFPGSEPLLGSPDPEGGGSLSLELGPASGDASLQKEDAGSLPMGAETDDSLLFEPATKGDVDKGRRRSSPGRSRVKQLADVESSPSKEEDEDDDDTMQNTVVLFSNTDKFVLMQVSRVLWDGHVGCVCCVQCGAASPGFHCEWQNNYTHCAPCASLVVCPFCREKYVEDDLLIQCRHCDRWLHAACDSLFTEEEVEQAADEGFDCSACQPYVIKPAAPVPAPDILAKAKEPEPQYFRFEGVWLTETGMAVLRNLTMSPLHKRRQRKAPPRLGALNGDGGLEGGDPLGPDDKKDGDLDADELLKAEVGVEHMECEIKLEAPASPERDVGADVDSGKGLEDPDECKKRKRKPYRPGIGGFMVRQRKSHTRLKKVPAVLADVGREGLSAEGHPEEGRDP